MKPYSLLGPSCPYRVAIETYERQMVERALEASGGNVLLCAQRLGVSRKYLYDRFAHLGIPVRNPRPRKKNGGNGHDLAAASLPDRDSASGGEAHSGDAAAAIATRED